MRLFHDLRNNLMLQGLGAITTDSGVADPGVSAPGSGVPVSRLPRAPLYLAGALALGLALLAAIPHRPSEAASLAQLEWQARSGSADAQLLLGLAYRHGSYGLKVDAVAGSAWIARAARGGNAYAAGLLGDAYAQGVGMAANHQRAVYWWRQAARGGDRHGAAQLGQKTSWQETLAPLWDINSQSGETLERHARDGDSLAQFQLAMRYRDGAWGVDADPRLALGWLRQSARHGNPVAMQALAGAYEKGELGLSVDPARAVRWRQRAELANGADGAQPSRS